MATAGTPDWWLDRLYKRLRDRQPTIKTWDDWYIGDHPLPKGYEKAGPMLMRLLETIGLNMLALVTDAALDRMQLEGFKINGKIDSDVWDIWQANNFDLGSAQVLQEKMALSESYGLVDPNGGQPILTPEHPSQCIVEYEPGSKRRLAGLKVWQDDLGDTPTVRAMVWLPDEKAGTFSYSAPTRIYADMNRSALALKPSWELQPSGSGGNSLGEVPLVPFVNRRRMLKAPLPEFYPAIPVQRRINKTLMDRMSMQDQGAFKAMWATGINIPRDPATNKPIEDFIKAIDRAFINENPAGKFGQLEAEDIKQMLEAVRDDVADAAMVVPTSADSIMGKLVNVSGDGLKLAQSSEITRVRKHMRSDEESFEDMARLSLKGAGKSVPNAGRMTSQWRNPEYRTEGEMADAGIKALSGGVPHEAVWTKYFGATPDEVKEWRTQLDRQQVDPTTGMTAAAQQIIANARANTDASAGA